MFDEYKHPNETVRQTLERVMREKGMWQEPKVMHTEIGDFHYYNDNNTADNSGENNNAGLPSDYLQNHNAYGSVMGGAIENTVGANVAPNTSSFELQSTYTPSPVYGTSASNNYQIQSPSDFASTTTPNTFGSSPQLPSLGQTQLPNYTSAANDWQINQATAATQNQQNQANQGQNVAWFGEPPAAIRQAIGRYAPDVLAQYSAPTSLGQASEVDYYFNRDKDELCENEGGFVPYAYLDTSKNHYATIGCGININKTPDIHLYNAQTGQPLSAEQLKAEIKKLNASEKNNKHTYYEDKSNIRIAPEENERIMKNKYVGGYNTVMGLYPDYTGYSEDRQKALMDMVYNLGDTGFTKYTHLRDAILQNDWRRAAEEAWRCGIGFNRNAKTVNRLYPGLDAEEMRLRHCKDGRKK